MAKYRFGDICEVLNGRAYKQNELLSSGKYPILRVGNFFSSDRWYYSDMELPENKYCDYEDLLFAWSASFGPKIWDGGKVIYHYHIWKLIPNDDVADKFYLYYWLQHSVNRLTAGTHGSVMAHMTKGDMENQSIELPSLQTQKKISSILRTIDEKIHSNEAINNNLFEQMQALYKAWFVDFEPFGGVRPPNWNDTNIYAIANIIYGAPFASKLFNTDGLGKPIIRIRDLEEQAFVTFTTEEHPKGHLIQPGDIVVGMDGEFRPYIWGNEPAWLNQRVCIFESNRPQGKAFVLYTIKPLLNKIEQTQVATTVIHIGKKDFDAFEIVLPDEATLDNFDSITAPMIEQIVNNRLQNKRLAVLRDTLLPKLMSGELDVSDIDL